MQTKEGQYLLQPHGQVIIVDSSSLFLFFISLQNFVYTYNYYIDLVSKPSISFAPFVALFEKP